MHLCMLFELPHVNSGGGGVGQFRFVSENLTARPVNAKLVLQKAPCFPLKPKSKWERNRLESWDCVRSFLDGAFFSCTFCQKTTEEDTLLSWLCVSLLKRR